MSDRGEKVREIITIRASFDKGEINDPAVGISYPTIQDAVIDAKDLYKRYSGTKEDKQYYRNLDVSVCFGEWEYESGDVFGEPTCISVKNFKTPIGRR